MLLLIISDSWRIETLKFNRWLVRTPNRQHVKAIIACVRSIWDWRGHGFETSMSAEYLAPFQKNIWLAHRS